MLRRPSQFCIGISRLFGAQLHASSVSQKECHSEEPHLFKKSVYFGIKGGEFTQKCGYLPAIVETAFSSHFQKEWVSDLSTSFDM